MSDQNLRIDLVASLSMVLLLVVHLVAVSLLPDTVPKHFSLDGTVTGEVSRFDWSRFTFPLLGVTVVPLLTFFKYRYYKSGNEVHNRRFTLISVSFAIVMWIAWTYVTVLTIQHSGVNMNVFENLLWIPGTLSLLLVISGSIMLFIGPNVLLGFRTEKTLADEDLWRRTNKFSGVILIVTGVIIFLLSLYIDDGSTRKVVSLSLTIASVVLSAIVYKLIQRDSSVVEDF